MVRIAGRAERRALTSGADPMQLKNLLAKARHYHPSYRDGLCNHCPMTLIALDRMGATPKRLQSYAIAYLRKMELAPPPGETIDAGNWRERLGDEAAYGDYLGFFRREVGRLSPRAALRAYLPELAPGIGAAAFHPVIRTAYGVIAEDPEEIAVGLGYWASRYLALPERADMPAELPFVPSDDPLQILKKTRTWPGLGFEPDPEALIDREMLRAANPTLFPLLAAALQIDDLTLDRLRQAAALMFLGVNDFNSLHAVTGLHAVRVLNDFAADRRSFAREVWRAVLALYLSLDRPELPAPSTAAELTAEDLPDWNAILPAAVADDDEHVIKLVFSCFAESRAGGGRLYRYLAARKAGFLGAIAADDAPLPEATQAAGEQPSAR
jgi:hypothetical protein